MPYTSSADLARKVGPPAPGFGAEPWAPPIIPHAARSDTSSKVWNFSVARDSRAFAWVVGMPARVASMADRNDAKFAWYLPYTAVRLANPHSRSITFRFGE